MSLLILGGCLTAYEEEGPLFYSNEDKSLHEIIDSVKKTAIIELRTFNSPIYYEEDCLKRGVAVLKFIKFNAKRYYVKIFAKSHPEITQFKRVLDRLVEASHYRNYKDKVNYPGINKEEFNALAVGSISIV